jgi:hypothetical protein
MDKNIETIILGDEFDDYLRAVVCRVLHSKHAKTISTQWGVGGSQEVEEVLFYLKNHEFKLTSETYRGLSLTGPSQIVREIANEVAKCITEEA